MEGIDGADLLVPDKDEQPCNPYAAGPVEILPGIGLGSEENALDWVGLTRRGIHAILNVAKEVNLSFETNQSSISLFRFHPYTKAIGTYSNWIAKSSSSPRTTTTRYLTSMLATRVAARRAAKLSRRFATAIDTAGIKVAAADQGQPTTAVTILVNTGSRYETKPGLANFLKKLCFQKYFD